MDHHNYSEDDRRLEERLVAALRQEGFFARPRPSAWTLYAAAAVAIFLLGVAAGARLAGRTSPPPPTVITTQEVLWF